MFKLPWPVVLASASPRRVELLGSLVSDFEILPADVDEEALTTLDPVQTAEHLARAKAYAVREARPEALVIGGDTVVALDETRQLAKPASAEEAKAMLRSLSGGSHRVITAICLCWPGGEDLFSVATAVVFRPLSEEEIDAYVRTGEPMDKAGAYAIQGGASGFVEHIEGSWSNVVGLPLEALKERLAAISA
jgi:septum formation protein